MKKYLIVLLVALISVGLLITRSNGLAYATAPEFSNVEQVIRFNNDTYILDGGTDGVETHPGHFIYISGADKTIGSYGYGDKELAYPKLFTLSVSKIFVYTSNNYRDDNYVIKILDNDGEHIATLNTYLDKDNRHQPIGSNITSMTTDVFGNLYILDADHRALLTCLADDTDYKLKELNITSLNITQDSNVIADIAGNVFIVDTNIIYKLDKDNNLTSFDLPSELSLGDLDIDCEGNIYSFVSTDVLTIYKIDLNDLSSIAQYTYNTISNTYSIDKPTGKVYYFDADTNSIKTFEPKYENNNIIPSIDSYTVPTSYRDNTALTTSITLAKAKCNTVGYQYPYFVNPNAEITQDEHVYILGSENDFYACLITTQNNYNILTYIYKDDLRRLSTPGSSAVQVISTHTAIAYKYPSSLLAYDGATTPLKTELSLPYGTEVKITKDYSKLADAFGNRFYEITVDSNKYYVNIACVSADKAKVTNNIQNNAKIVITDGTNDVILYKLSEEEFIDSGIKLAKDQKINIIEYNQNKEYQHINYIDDDGNFYEGYVKTKYTRMNGIEVGIIVAIIMLVICFILTIVILTTSKKNR